MYPTAAQWAVNALIWGLTAAGAFFGLRGMLRRRKDSRNATPEQASGPSTPPQLP